MVPTRWVKADAKGRDWKKQYYYKGAWIDKKPHSFTWKRYPYIAMGINETDWDRDNVPIFTASRVSLHQLYASIFDTRNRKLIDQRIEDYNYAVKTLLVGEDLRAAWKAMTLKIVDIAIRSIPAPSELTPFLDVIYSFFNYFAESFYDFMFSL